MPLSDSTELDSTSIFNVRLQSKLLRRMSMSNFLNINTQSPYFTSSSSFFTWLDSIKRLRETLNYAVPWKDLFSSCKHTSECAWHPIMQRLCIFFSGFPLLRTLSSILLMTLNNDFWWLLMTLSPLDPCLVHWVGVENAFIKKCHH